MISDPAKMARPDSNVRPSRSESQLRLRSSHCILNPPSDFYAIAIQIPHEHWIALSRLARVGFHVENPIWLEAWEYGGKERKGPD
jgi:hypothetical protein